MWRRYGDDLYAFLVLSVFTAEALVLGFLTWRFAAGASQALGGGSTVTVLVFSVAVTALALVTIGGYVLAYHVLSSRSERGRRERTEAWTARWVAVLFQEEEPPPEPLPPEGVESLLDLREHLAGSEGERVESLVRRYRIGEGLLERSASPVRGRWPLRRVGSGWRRRLSRRLDALESLAKARLPQSVEPLLLLLEDREPALRLMALRTVARSLARMPDGPHRDRAVLGFAEAVTTAEVPAGAVEECLLLLEGAAPEVLAILLAAHDPPLLSRAIDAAGRLKLLELGDDVAVHCRHPEPEVRAAALRTLGRMGFLPASQEAGVVAALSDPVEFVRVQASRTAVLLPRDTAQPALWELLGDRSWWVRRAAAQSLLGLGMEGPRLLQSAGTDHPDRYARHMAVQVLLDAGRLDPELARTIRGTA